jgi:diadenosine tetraphosphate (Ap4A) HIT family hydrolase
MTFKLHQNFSSKIHVCDMSMSSVYLEPISDIKWFMVIPRINDIKNILDLNGEQKSLLWKEIDILSSVINDLYKPDQINIAMLGNVTPQLHCHVIARFKDDKAWPDATFGRKDFSKISEDDAKVIIDEVSICIKKHS